VNRTPESELMLGVEQARQYAEADFAEPHDHFIALLSRRLPDLANRGEALDLGCGPGDVTLRFARAFPGWSVDGVDGSPTMLAFAHAALAPATPTSQVHFAHAYLPADSPPRDAYDLVYSNSLLHHLEDPNVLWSSVARYARLGSAVFARAALMRGVAWGQGPSNEGMHQTRR
jgi:trans-aconitate methyltransferase